MTELIRLVVDDTFETESGGVAVQCTLYFNHEEQIPRGLVEGNPVYVYANWLAPVLNRRLAAYTMVKRSLQ